MTMNARLALAAALAAPGLLATAGATEYSCDWTKDFVKDQGYSQISLTDGCRGKVCNANPKYGAPNDPVKALLYCEDRCTERKGCTGFFFQTHGNGHEICGFFSTEVDLGNAVHSGGRHGAVCVPEADDDDGDKGPPSRRPTQVPEPREAPHPASDYSCDLTKDFVKDQGYGQISLTDGCRGKVCNANPKYGAPNDPVKAVAWCEDECTRRGDGCKGFFFQTHGNGHEICGFFGTEVDLGNAVHSGGRHGAVCVPEADEDDGDEVPDVGPHPDYVGPGGCTSRSDTFLQSEPVVGAGMSGCRDLCAGHTACVGYTAPAVPTGDCFYYTDLALFRRQPHRVDVVPPVWPPLDDPVFSCDMRKNFVRNQGYSQTSLTDHCRDGVCDANPKYGAENDPQAAIRYCKKKCRAGCTGFFFQTHGNGHEICGFLYAEVDEGNAVWDGHRNGALCTKNPPEDDFPIDVVGGGPRRLQDAGGYCRDFLGVPSQYGDAFAPGMTVRVAGSATKVYQVTKVVPPRPGSISRVSQIYLNARSLQEDMGCTGDAAVVTTNCRSVGDDPRCAPSRDAPSTVDGSDGAKGMTCYLHHQRHGSTRFTGLDRHEDHWEEYEVIMGTAGRAPLLPSPDDAPRPDVARAPENLLRRGRSVDASQPTGRSAPLVPPVGGLMDVPLKNGNWGSGTATYSQIMKTTQPLRHHFRGFDWKGKVKEITFRWVLKALRSDESKRCQKSRFQGCCSWSEEGTPRVCGKKCHDTEADYYNYCHLSPSKCYDCKGHWLDPEYDHIATPPWGEGEGQVPAECPSNAHFWGHIPENDYKPCTGKLDYDCFTDHTSLADICSTSNNECIHYAFDSWQESMITLLSFFSDEAFKAGTDVTGKSIQDLIKRKLTGIVVTKLERYWVTAILLFLGRVAIDRMAAGLQEWIEDQLITVGLQPLIHWASRLFAMEGLANEQPKESWEDLWESMLQDIDPTGISRIADAISSDACDEISPPFPRDNSTDRLVPDGLCLIGFAEDENGTCVPSECDKDAFRFLDGPPYEIRTLCHSPVDYVCANFRDHYATDACRYYDLGYGVAWHRHLDGSKVECYVFKEKAQHVAQKVPVVRYEANLPSDPVAGAICLPYEAIPDFRYTNETKVKVTCNIILDGKLEGVWYNDVNLTSVVKGDFNNRNKMKSVRFEAVPWEAYLAVTAKANGEHYSYCSAASFQIECDNGITSSTEGWESISGSTVLRDAHKQGMGKYWSPPCASTSNITGVEEEEWDVASLWGDDWDGHASFRMKM